MSNVAAHYTYCHGTLSDLAAPLPVLTDSLFTECDLLFPLSRFSIFFFLKFTVTCKVPPRTGHEGPKGEYRYSSTFSLTSVLDAGNEERSQEEIYHTTTQRRTISSKP